MGYALESQGEQIILDVVHCLLKAVLRSLLRFTVIDVLGSLLLA